MSGYVRWGILGNAMIARDFMIPALKGSETAKVTGVASRGTYPDGIAPEAKRYASYDALLADPEIDAVYTPVPNALHEEWTVRALRAGKHVLCEKPLATDPAAAERMEKEAEARGLILMEAFMYRYGAGFRKMKELLDEGAVGRIRGMSCVNGYLLDWPSPAREERALGGGCVYDIGCYVADCMNEAAKTSGGSFTDAGCTFRMEGGVDRHAAGWISYGEIPASFECWFDAPARQILTITGEKGILELTDPFEPGPTGMRLVTEAGTEEAVLEEREDPYRAEAEAVSLAILTGVRSALIPPAASKEMLRVLDRLHKDRPL